MIQRLPLLALLVAGCATTPLPPASAPLQAHLAAVGTELEAVAAGLDHRVGTPSPPMAAAYARARTEAAAAGAIARARVAAAASPSALRVASEIADAVAACGTAIAGLEARHLDPGLSRGLFHLSATAETCEIARETDRLLGR